MSQALRYKSEGIACRYYYTSLIAGSGATLTIYKVAAGVTTQLAQAAVTAAADIAHDVRLSVIGNQLTAYLDGLLAASAFDPTPLSGGSVGISLTQPTVTTPTAAATSFRGSRLGVTKQTYLPTGLVQAEIDPLNFRTTYSYDPVGRRTAALDARGGIASTVYDLDGQVIARIDADGNTTSFQYDNALRP